MVKVVKLNVLHESFGETFLPHQPTLKQRKEAKDFKVIHQVHEVIYEESQRN